MTERQMEKSGRRMRRPPPPAEKTTVRKFRFLGFILSCTSSVHPCTVSPPFFRQSPELFVCCFFFLPPPPTDSRTRSEIRKMEHVFFIFFFYCLINVILQLHDVKGTTTTSTVNILIHLRLYLYVTCTCWAERYKIKQCKKKISRRWR